MSMEMGKDDGIHEQKYIYVFVKCEAYRSEKYLSVFDLTCDSVR